MGLLSLMKSLVFVGLVWGVNPSIRSTADGLSVDYYGQSCPLADAIVRKTVDAALGNDPTLAAGLLRLHFHDCFVQGCDGSVLLDSIRTNKAEKDAVPNQSLRGFEVIYQAKQYVEEQCRGVVSCADIVAMAARDAVHLAGGPYYEVPKGRRDGVISRAQDALISLPSPLLDTTGLIQAFALHGLTPQEMVALSGGHTLGVASCNAFKNRLSNFSSTTNVDPSLHPIMAIMLSRICKDGDAHVAPLDWTNLTFDNSYFKALQMSGGLLSSDQTLYTDERTRGFVNTYATSPDAFFLDFSSAMVKMGTLNVKEGKYGQVRLNCRKVN